MRRWFQRLCASWRNAPDVPSHSSQLDYIIRRHLRPEKRINRRQTHSQHPHRAINTTSQNTELEEHTPFICLYFGNWVNRCYSWYLSKTEVQSLQWSPGAKQLCLRGEKLFVLNSTNMRDEQIQQAAGKQSLQFPCALCHTGLPGVYVILIY